MTQQSYILTPKPRPDELISKTVKCPIGQTNIYVTVSFATDGSPFEVFAAIGKSGSVVNAWCEATTRMISLWLRSGGAPKEIIENLRGIGTEEIGYAGDGVRYLSAPDAIAQVLIGVIKDPANSQDTVEASTLIILDLCGETMGGNYSCTLDKGHDHKHEYRGDNRALIGSANPEPSKPICQGCGENNVDEAGDVCVHCIAEDK